jgi:hypothetical protein
MKIRMPNEIVEQLLAVSSLPTEVREAFEELKISIAYIPPEDLRRAYLEICEVANDYIPKPPVEDWHFAAAAAVMNVTVDAIRKQFPGRN